MEEAYQSKILIIDDDPTNLNVLLDYLHQSGYKVLVAPSGEQALRQMHHVLPDVILLDIMMPGIDGFETCRRLKAQDATREIPVIFMTALSDMTDKIAGFAVGGVDYITKPFQYEDVSVRVKTHLTLRRLQQDLQRRNQELHDANAGKDKFFSILAHDLRSPLSALRELPNIVLDNADQYSREDLLGVMFAQRDAARNLFALLENLLTWARIQRGLIEYAPQALRLDRPAAENIELLRLNARQKQIEIRNLATTPLVVRADEHILNTILRNLLSNAIKFTKPGGTVTLSATPAQSMADISITDTGIGMTPEQISKIFRIDAKFKRCGTAGEQGTGLGLILCREFVRQHGGDIAIASRIDHGTTVTVTLPLAQ